MPSNLTWPEARALARAGTPVRREGDPDPLKWFTHVTGLWFYHEEQNVSLPSPAAADPVPHVVRATEFLYVHFISEDWTTLRPGQVDPPATATPAPTTGSGGTGGGSSGTAPAPATPTPATPIPAPPGVPPPATTGGGSYPPVIPGQPLPPPNPPPILVTGGGGGNPAQGDPPTQPPKNNPIPTPSVLPVLTGSALKTSGVNFGCDINPVFVGCSWSVAVAIPARGYTGDMGVALNGATHLTLTATVPGVMVGDSVIFTAFCTAGPQDLTHSLVPVTGTCLVS